MRNKTFDYEDVFMGVREKKPSTYLRRFRDDYRIYSLVKTIKTKTGTILDIGCGGGMLTESLPYYYPKAKIYGCDISKTAIKYAQKSGSGKVNYGVIRNKKLPYKDNFFDVCICFDVLEHIPDANFFLKEVKRVLKKNGKFFLIVPCEGEPFTYTWLFQKVDRLKDLTYRYFGHIHPEFTHKSVGELLEKHGFSPQKKAYSEHVFYQLSHLLIFFLPKLLLEVVFKKKASEYTDSGLVRSPKKKTDLLIIIRNFWFIFFNFMMKYPMYSETVLLRKISPTAWKMHILVTKKGN